MIEAFVVLVAVVDSRPGMPWIAVSMGVDTSLLTTSGEAPGTSTGSTAAGTRSRG
jgi:hypothetical protein